MLRTAGWLALPGRALSAGFDGGISPPFQFVAAPLLGGWDLTEARLSLASPTRLVWTHSGINTRSGRRIASWQPLAINKAAAKENMTTHRIGLTAKRLQNALILCATWLL